MRKKLTAVLLAALMLMSIMPVTSVLADGESDTGKANILIQYIMPVEIELEKDGEVSNSQDNSGYIEIVIPEYAILSGDNSKWTKGAKESVAVTCSGAYDELSAVYMDGKPIDENCFDLFPTAIAIADGEANISRSLEGRAAGVNVIANIGIGEPVQLKWSPVFIADGGADSRITDPDRVIMFRVPWVDDQANNIGTPGDRGRQLAIILDDYSLSVIPLGGYVASGKEIITPVLTGRALLFAGFPKEDTLSDDAVIRERGVVSGDASPLYVVDGVPSSEVPEATTPGSGATIRVRGGSSLSASNDPLIIVDGMATDGNPSGASTIRIRGLGAFNNDPLIVVDGVSTTSELRTFTSDEHNPGLKSRAAITQDGISILFCVGKISDLPANGEGSVIDVSAFTGIELKPEYLETLSVGKHTLTFEYKDGQTVSTEIEIIAQENPETGDNMTALWILLCAAAMLCGAVIIKKCGE